MLVLAIAWIIAISCNEMGHPQPIITDVTTDVVSPKEYVIHHTSEKLTIDGLASETDWQKTPFTTSFIDIEGITTPEFDTRVKMLWDEDFFYIYAQLEEPHVSGNLQQHDTIIFIDNDFEIFIDPTDDTFNYFELEINALNTTWDLKLDRAYRSLGKAESHYEMTGLKSAVNIQGTINNPNDIDKGWSIEIAIPLDAVMPRWSGRSIVPKDGDYWRVNFSRVEWDRDFVDGKYLRRKEGDQFLPEHNWVWSNQKVINMHEPEKWGYGQFSTNTPGKEKEFQKIEDVVDKQVSYSLLRKVRFGELKPLLERDALFTQAITARLKDINYDCLFIKTNSGFEIKVLNTISNKEYIINELGFFKELP